MVHGVLFKRMYSVQDYRATTRPGVKPRHSNSMPLHTSYFITSDRTSGHGHDACLAANTGTLAGDIGHEDKDSPYM